MYNLKDLVRSFTFNPTVGTKAEIIYYLSTPQVPEQGDMHNGRTHNADVFYVRSCVREIGCPGQGLFEAGLLYASPHGRYHAPHPRPCASGVALIQGWMARMQSPGGTAT